MELLPLDIKRILVNILPIPDKRNLIRSCKTFNQLYYLMKSYETEFEELLNVTKFVSDNPRKFNQCELYALEYIYHDRDNIPDKYLEHNTDLLEDHSLLYFNMAMNQNKICKKIYQKYENYITSIMKGAVLNGDLEMVKWARENGCEWHTDIARYAAGNGNLEVLKWIRDNGCAWNNWTCRNAAAKGNLEVLKWAHENGCEWDEWTCTDAAENGHLKVLKWARDNGCPWNEETCSSAARLGHLEVLKWAHENGCKWGTVTCACATGNLEILKYVRDKGCAR